MEIKTFVFFDLETTGLIQGTVMPRITEIALIAVSKESICKSNENSPPRVVHKLVLPINPQKVIPSKVEHMTKLYNEDVQMLQPFENELYELITHFLQRLAPPICFVAHYGDKFDYPIFLRELERIDKILNNDILCIDTWKMFQDFFKKKDMGPKLMQELLNDEYNDSLSTVDIDVVVAKENSKIVATSSTTQTFSNVDKYSEIINDGKVKEYNNTISVQPSKMQKVNETTPKNQVIKSENIFVQRPFKKHDPKRKLNFECNKPINLKLGAIYEYMFGSNFSYSHSAEADCLAMMRCVINVADFFLDWSRNHAIPLIYKKNIT